MITTRRIEPSPELLQKALSRVVPGLGEVKGMGLCWVYTGHRTSKGYGRMHTLGRMVLVHRVVYEGIVGEIPDGLALDHLCRNRSCCRPSHLEPVDNNENTRRGLCGIQHRVKTHCPHGHKYDEANTYFKPASRSRGPQRCCRMCARLKARRDRERKDLKN